MTPLLALLVGVAPASDPANTLGDAWHGKWSGELKATKDGNGSRDVVNNRRNRNGSSAVRSRICWIAP